MNVTSLSGLESGISHEFHIACAPQQPAKSGQRKICHRFVSPATMERDTNRLRRMAIVGTLASFCGQTVNKL
jgi:hypothetical protein